ncbi:MAG: metallophosphoesterase, partial [Candidatus Eremiobacteraeota bacterium]|nr:metallophosphoesterase [Candidatus Eremiobacteraeota bacterium]
AMRVIALDTSQHPRQGGYLDAARLKWFEETLAQAPLTPTIVAMHHPPFRTGLFYFDDQAFEGVDRFAAIVKSQPQIRRIVSGHVHQVLQTSWQGTLAVTSPSTAPSLVVRPNARGVSFEPGGFLLHRMDGAGVLRTRLVRTPPDVMAIGA